MKLRSKDPNDAYRKEQLEKELQEIKAKEAMQQQQAPEPANGKTQQQMAYHLPEPNSFQKLIGRKLRCSVYLLKKDKDGNVIGRKYIGEKMKKVGDDMFTWKERKYYIDYNYVYEGRKVFEYECDVQNAIGGLACFDNKTSVNTITGTIPPDKAQAFYTSLQGELFLHNNGIPKLWFLLALIGAIVMGTGLMMMVTQYMSINTKYTNDHTYLCQIEPTHQGCPPPKPVTTPPAPQPGATRK